jgi:hypothetical protein
MIDIELLEMLESVVLLAPADKRALDGKRTYGADVNVQSHIEVRNDMVRNTSGEEVMSAGRCHLDSHYPEVTESSRLTLPDGAQPSVIAVAHTYDSEGPYQTVVYW